MLFIIARPESAHIARNTFAVFMEPNFDVTMELPEGKAESDAAVDRFKKGMNFGDFSKVPNICAALRDNVSTYYFALPLTLWLLLAYTSVQVTIAGYYAKN